MLSSLIDTSKQDRFTLFIQTVYKWENIKSIFVWHFYFFHHNQNVIHWQWQCQQGMQKNYNILKCKQTTKVIDVILDYFIHCLQKKLKHFATNRPDKKRVELFYE